MKKILIFIFLILFPAYVQAAPLSLAQKLKGRILLQVESHGKAWYVNPKNEERYYMGRPADAFKLMRELGLGVSNTDFESFATSTPKRLAGKIILKVEDVGQAYYINPIDMNMHYLGKPIDAFNIMRQLALGISNTDLDKILIYDPNRPKLISHNVPFRSQAPFGEWGNDIFQDGCEEASIIMALAWVNNKTVSQRYMHDEIIKITNYELKQYGEHHDISTYDTSQVIKNYLKYEKIKYITDITLNQIVNELESGNIIIAPTNGQILNNPHFVAPGPLNHMLVITGYNPLKKQFITNDPGTRWGKNFKYSQDVLFESIRDYPTGYYEPNPNIKKNVIIVQK